MAVDTKTIIILVIISVAFFAVVAVIGFLIWRDYTVKGRARSDVTSVDAV